MVSAYAAPSVMATLIYWIYHHPLSELSVMKTGIQYF